ncbi:NEAT domain-containing protein [Cohnella cellulosilytica]|uniref:NEAT domain-containing protein n=1 Tax=Cohnella cellulosilytica TaxID=986710 RepID=A0ABW2FMN7_9BACL
MKKNAGKWISLTVALLLLLSATPVLAAEGTEGNAPERSYEVSFKVLKDGTDEVSAADEYVQKPAKVTVEGGVGYAEVTLLKSAWISAFEVEQDGKLTAAPVIGSDEKADTRVVKFPVGDIREKLNVRIAVEVPAMNYQGDYKVQLAFDTAGMPGAPAEQGDTEPAAPGNDGREAAFAVLKDGTDEPSSLGNYTSKTGRLYERDGASYFSFTLLSSSLIPSFQYEANGEYVDATVVSEDKDADSRVVEIAVADAAKKLNVALEVNAGPYGIMQHKAQILIAAEEEQAESSFADIENHWAKAAIEQTVSLGIVKGIGDNTFNPNGKVTRAQLAVILTSALKLNSEAEALSFADQAEIPGYAAAAIAQVQAAGLLVGYSDDTFRPNTPVNRAQLAVIIARIAHLELAEDAAPTFGDAQDIPAWAKSSVAAAVEAGLISGRGNNAFAPAADTTRAEAVSLVLKVLLTQH